MTRIYLIRHAEAEGNLYRRIHGQYDSGVTDRGERQLAALRQRFDGVPLDAVYTSPLHRAHQTAKAVRGTKEIPIYLEPGLLEISMGPWEDLPFGEAIERAPETMRLFRSADPAYTLEGGETYQQLQARQVETYLRLARENEGRTIACVSHSMALRTLLCWCHGWGLQRLSEVPKSDNTGVSRIEIEGGKPRLLYEADAAHLPGELSTLQKQTWWRGARALSDANLWFRDWEPVGERQLYLECCQELWQTACGSAPFDGEGRYAAARQAVKSYPHSVRVAMNGQTVVGLLQLDLERDAGEKTAFLSLCCLCPPYRGNGLGVQLVGEAVSLCRSLGLKRLRLRCSPENEFAKRFYQANGFDYIGPATDSEAPLELLEKRIAMPGAWE